MSYQRTYPRGFGAVNPAPTTGQLISTGILSAGTVAGALVGGPVGAAVAIGISAATALLQGVINGCGSTCQVTSTWANQVESVLQQNIAAYFALPTPRSTVDQAAAIQNFNTAWNALVSECNNPSLGSAGQNCISEREAGACHWTQPASAVPLWGSPPAGACWNWFNGYLDPIQNDPDVYTPSNVVPASLSTATDAISNLISGAGISTETLFLVAAAGILAWVVLK